ncbi:MAG: DUF4443 domain-containing protein [Candidatus Caldarchaeales archaeon]
MRAEGPRDLLLEGAGRLGQGVPLGPVIYLRALFALSRENMISRSALGARLGVGEGTARTIIRRLAQRGLVNVIRSGCILSDRGREFLKGLSELMTEPKPIRLDEVWSYEHSVGVIVRRASGHVGRGLDERDEAIRHGAEAAMVLSYVMGRVLMPEVSDISEEHPGFARKLLDELCPNDGDVMLIAGARSYHAAESGALGSAVYLARKMLASGTTPVGSD